jgi:hypothetical protein
LPQEAHANKGVGFFVAPRSAALPHAARRIKARGEAPAVKMGNLINKPLAFLICPHSLSVHKGYEPFANCQALWLALVHSYRQTIDPWGFGVLQECQHTLIKPHTIVF